MIESDQLIVSNLHGRCLKMAKKGEICQIFNFELVVLEPRIDPRIAVMLGRPVGAWPMPIRSGVHIGEPKVFPEFVSPR